MATLICSSLIATRRNTISSPPPSPPHRRRCGKKMLVRLSALAPRFASPAVRWSGKEEEKGSAAACHRKRGELVVVRAGGPSTTTYIFAFIFPLSLIIVTVIASMRIADKLDEQYLEELAMNKSIMEEKEREEDDDEEEEEENESGKERVAATPAEEKISAVGPAAAAPRVRNRPKREV